MEHPVYLCIIAAAIFGFALGLLCNWLFSKSSVRPIIDNLDTISEIQKSGLTRDQEYRLFLVLIIGSCVLRCLFRLAVLSAAIYIAVEFCFSITVTI